MLEYLYLLTFFSWIPLAVMPQLEQPWNNREIDPANWWLVIIARLRPGVAHQQAQSALNTLPRHFRPQSVFTCSFRPTSGCATGSLASSAWNSERSTRSSSAESCRSSGA